jgi:hypothetical protein
LPEAVQAEVAAVNAIGANIMAYATNRELKFKFEHFTTAAADARQDNFDRGKLYVAKLLHPGGCNAARRAAISCACGDSLNCGSAPSRGTGASDPSYSNITSCSCTVIIPSHAPGTQATARTWAGGILFADSICSAASSTKLARNRRDFPSTVERIPPSDPLFTSKFGGDDLSSVERREPQRAAADAPLRSQVRVGEPYLEGLKLGDRYAVIFSPFDISCALENHESLECEGYTRKDAARIGLNVLLYSFHQ